MTVDDGTIQGRISQDDREHCSSAGPDWRERRRAKRDHIRSAGSAHQGGTDGFGKVIS